MGAAVTDATPKLSTLLDCAEPRTLEQIAADLARDLAAVQARQDAARLALNLQTHRTPLSANVAVHLVRTLDGSPEALTALRADLETAIAAVLDAHAAALERLARSPSPLPSP